MPRRCSILEGDAPHHRHGRLQHSLPLCRAAHKSFFHRPENGRARRQQHGDTIRVCHGGAEPDVFLQESDAGTPGFGRPQIDLRSLNWCIVLIDDGNLTRDGSFEDNPHPERLVLKKRGCTHPVLGMSCENVACLSTLGRGRIRASIRGQFEHGFPSETLTEYSRTRVVREPGSGEAVAHPVPVARVIHEDFRLGDRMPIRIKNLHSQVVRRALHETFVDRGIIGGRRR